MLQCFLEMRTSPLSACFWGRAAVRGFMSAEQNQLKPVWGRQRSDRNNNISVIHMGDSLGSSMAALYTQPLWHRARCCCCCSLLPGSRRAMLLIAWGAGRSGKGRGQQYVSVCGSAACTQTQEHVPSVCMCVCGWKCGAMLPRSSSSTQQMDVTWPCALGLWLVGKEQDGFFLQAGWGGWLFFF